MNKEQLINFAKWLGDNKFVFDGFNIWKQVMYSPSSCYTCSPPYLLFTTEQLVEKFLKENLASQISFTNLNKN